MTQAPLIWNPRKNNEKEKNKYYEYYNNLLRKYDLNYLKNLIQKCK